MKKTRPESNAKSAFLWLATVFLSISAIPAVAGPLEKFHALEDAMVEAQEAHVESIEGLAKINAGGASGKAESKRDTKLPPDRRLLILHQIDALAQSNLADPDAAPIAMGAFYWSWILDLDPDNLTGRFEQIVKHYPNQPSIDELLATVAEIGAGAGTPEQWIRLLEQLGEKTKRPETMVGALFAIGRVGLTAGNLPQATTAFEKVLALGAQSDYGSRAKGYIFEINHLQIGMVAPDFTTTTLDGKSVALRSFRGKPVLLDFWATW